MWSIGKEWKIFLEDSILFDFQLKVYYISTIMWEEFTSVVLNRCVIWNRIVTNCRRWSAMPKPLQLIQSHICIILHIYDSVLWTSVFLWRFGDNKNVLLFPITLLYIRISFSAKLGLKFKLWYWLGTPGFIAKINDNAIFIILKRF